MRTPALMFQGTGSDVGKSLIVAGLCRLFAKRGVKVLPFKPQNMSNNAALAADGGEIGRAQALQARACFASPSHHMNPVLLKPESETGAQIIVQGRMWGRAKAADYRQQRQGLLEKVLESYSLIAAKADLVLIEGAGSPAETNLRDGDIANMGFAIAADVPAVLIGDIERGGVIASIVGTRAVLDPGEAERIKGFIVNKFRGDPALFEDGAKEIADRTHWPCLGIVPAFPFAHQLPAEDAMALSAFRSIRAAGNSNAIKIVVPRLPRISNFDDLDPLRLEDGVIVQMVESGEPLPLDADLILLPGSKATIGDLKAFVTTGWDIDLKAYRRRGGRILGLCGGYQMLGQRICDPKGIEGDKGYIDGLGLLNVETELRPMKSLLEVLGTDLATGESVRGYEMHIGRTEGGDCSRPMLDLAGRPDGALSEDGRVAGCYVHGLFASDGFRQAFLRSLKAGYASDIKYEEQVEAALDALAQHLERSIDINRLEALAHA